MKMPVITGAVTGSITDTRLYGEQEIPERESYTVIGVWEEVDGTSISSTGYFLAIVADCTL